MEELGALAPEQEMYKTLCLCMVRRPSCGTLWRPGAELKRPCAPNVMPMHVPVLLVKPMRPHGGAWGPRS